MIVNDQSVYHMSLPKGGSSSKALLKENQYISIVLISAGCVLCALIGGLIIGAHLENSRGSHCYNSTDADSSWLCPASLSPAPVVAPATAATTSTSRSLMTTTKEVEVQRGPLALLKPAAIEIGIFAIFQAFGIRALRRTTSVVSRRLPQLMSRIRTSSSLGRVLSGALTWIRAFLRRSGYNSYKVLKNFYKKTAASKVVTRAKKIIKNVKKKKGKKNNDEEKKAAY